VSYPLRHRHRRSLVVLALAGLLAGCGGSGSSSAPHDPTNPLTNPDVIIFGSGRSQDASWRFYAMNPDGSSVVRVTGLNSLNARLSQGVSLNQSGTFASVTLDAGVQPGPGPEVERQLVRLNDGTILFSALMSIFDPQTLFAANSSGSQIAILGSPAPADPYALYMLAPDGTRKTRVFTVPSDTDIRELLFAPDNRTLYFVALTAATTTAPAISSLYKLPIGAAAPTLLATIDAPIRSVHTSRDGSRLAFLQVTEAQNLQSATITPYTLNANGTGLSQGTPIPINAFLEPWDAVIASRADGFHILYAAPVDGANEIFDVLLNGSGKAQITSNAAGNASPGSRQATTTNTLRGLGGR